MIEKKCQLTKEQCDRLEDLRMSPMGQYIFDTEKFQRY